MCIPETILLLTLVLQIFLTPLVLDMQEKEDSLRIYDFKNLHYVCCGKKNQKTFMWSHHVAARL